MKIKKYMAALSAAAVIGSFGGCAVIDTSDKPVLEKKVQWAMLPIINRTETPQAGLRAEAITESLLLVRRVPLKKFTASLNREGIFDESEEKLMKEAIGWAKQSGARYAVTGTVDEWRYKVGIDGEPAVGVTLKIIDLSNDAVVWSGAGARAGWSRESLSGTAQKLIDEMLEKVHFEQ